MAKDEYIAIKTAGSCAKLLKNYFNVAFKRVLKNFTEIILTGNSIVWLVSFFFPYDSLLLV